MQQNPGLGHVGRGYVSAVVVFGVVVVLYSITQLAVEPIGYEWFLLAGLTLVSGSATVKLPSSYASISISETFVFTAVLLYGPAAGTVIVALDGLVISFWIAKRHKEPYRALFNMSAPAVSAWCSAQLFFALSGISPLIYGPAALYQILPALFVFAVTYFTLNSWLIAFIISIERRVNALHVWRTTLLWLSLNYFCGASVAVLLVLYNRKIDIGYVGVIVPLLLVLYFTFKTAMARVDDADHHVAELNRLYLSTIETLAMAIDAKDQVTHGHIRRVQRYAVELARCLGVVEDQLIRAIEAAALLHDMGKLAVPEYILNKPGKLTEAEFEKMKLHASVGADILSAIEFPYPVVPIVRHHHESWDGTGYPAGLSGTDIPIGARILAVVDCFDALTSDRPYRPRLTEDQALDVLRERRGAMYDPLVVDTFINVHKDIATALKDPERHTMTVPDVLPSLSTRSLAPSNRLEEITASVDETLTLYDLAQSLAGSGTLTDIAEAIATHLRRLIPHSLCVFYVYDSERDEIFAAHAIGHACSSIKGLRITLGQRLSGWIAANAQTIVNSDPTLDFGEIARTANPRLRSCIGTPIIADDTLVGVLTLYSTDVDAFTDNYKRVIEAVSRQIAFAIKATTGLESTTHVDSITGLPTGNILDALALAPTASTGKTLQVALVGVSISKLIDIGAKYGSSAAGDAVRHVASCVRQTVPRLDLLCRDSDDRLIMMLTAEDRSVIDNIASAVSQNINSHPLVLNNGRQIQLDVNIVCAISPLHGLTLDELLRTVRFQGVGSHKAIVH